MSMFEKLNKLACSTALATLLVASPALAEETTPPTTAETNAAVSESVQDEATAKVDEKREALIDDATLALEKTQEALTALDEGDTEAALDALAIATGKLEIVVAREPELALAPVGTQLITRDFLGGIESIEESREVIEDLIEDGKFQEARPLMRAFASEILVETTNLPLATYPESIKRASAQIDDGEIEAAKRTLETALSTVVITEDVIALPVLRAELLIDAARAAIDGDASADGASDASSEEAADVEPISPGEYVSAARTQLEMAEALGYGGEDDFTELRSDLDKLDEKIEAEEETGGIFDTIGRNFNALKERLFGEAT